MDKRIEIFCCYARKDQRLLDELKTHLRPLEREGLITLWADTDISAGTAWEDEINKHLATADIFLLFVSPDFVSSEYCYSIEMQRAMERHEQADALVIPIILRPVDWQDAPFGKLQVLPTNAEPVFSRNWHSQDEAFLDVARGIRKAVKTFQMSLNIPQPIKMHPLGITLVTYRGHTSRVRRVTWSPDGSRIASSDSCMIDDISVSATVQIWDAANGRGFLTHRAPSENVVTALAWSPNSTRVASSYLAPDNTVDIWDATTGHVFFTYQGRAVSLAWSSDGRRIVSTDRDTMRIWDVASGRNLLIWAVGQQHEVDVVAWSPDGTRIASGGEHVTDANVVASFGPERGAVQVWDAITGSRLLICQGSSVQAVAWSPDSTRIASGNSNGTVQVWDAKNGEELLIYQGHSSREICAVAWSPDGSYIASGGSDKTVQVWDAKNGLRLLTYQGYSGSYRASIAWSPDSTYIASIGKEGTTVQIWRAT